MSEQAIRPHAGLAAVFSFIFNGLGQIYNGQIAKGLVIILISSLGLLVFLAGSIIIGAFLLGKIISLTFLMTGFLLFLAGIIFIAILGIYSIYDAYNFASRK